MLAMCHYITAITNFIQHTKKLLFSTSYGTENYQLTPCFKAHKRIQCDIITAKWKATQHKTLL